MVLKIVDKFGAAALLSAIALFDTATFGVSSSPVESAAKLRLSSETDIKWDNDVPFLSDAGGKLHKSTLDPELQNHLQAFIAERGAPIASVVVIDVVTGEVLAMAQGRSPEKWGSSSHTALYSRFPAASLFKTVVTTAALEMTPTGPD